MKFVVAAALSSLLFAAVGRADDARQAANQVMRDALLKQATPPATPPALPDRLPAPQRPTPEKLPPPKKDAGNAVHQAARGYGAHDANAMRAEMANRAALGWRTGATRQSTWGMGEGMWGMGQGTWDMMNASSMMRWRGMNPGGGGGGCCCCCCGGMGPGRMGSGGLSWLGGATGPGSAVPSPSLGGAR